MKKGITLPTVWWTDIEGYEGRYQISINGEVKSTQYWRGTYERILKPGKDGSGYLQVFLYKDGKGKMHHVHRLVAEAWLPNPNNLPEVNHIDEDKTNNHVNNLEWCDRAYNCNYGTCQKRIAEKNTNGKASKAVVALDKQGRVVHVFPSTREAERNGYTHTDVAACCRKVKGYKFHKGLIWLYKDDFLKKTL